MTSTKIYILACILVIHAFGEHHLICGILTLEYKTALTAWSQHSVDTPLGYQHAA